MTEISDSEEPSRESDEQFGRVGHRIVFSVLSGGGSTLLLAVLGAVVIRLITTRVGPTHYGDFVVALVFVSTVMLLTDLGITSITARDIARSPKEAGVILGQNLGLRLVLSAMIVPLVILTGFVVYRPAPLRWSIALIALSVPFNVLMTLALSYYGASIRNYLVSGIAIVQQVLYVAGVAIALATGQGIVGCSASYLISTAVASVIAFFAVRREVPFKPMFDLHRWRQILALSASLGAIQLINVLYLKADTLLLSKMASARAVGFYGVAYNFTNVILLVPTLVATSVMPLLATSAGERFAHLVRRMEHTLAVFGVVSVVLAVLFAHQAVAILSGQQFQGAATPLKLLALSCYFSFLCTALGYAAVACNRHHRMIIVSAVGLALNVVLNVVLIPRYGINGAATATLISEFIALVGVRIVYARDIGSKLSLTKLSARPIAVGAVVVTFAHYVLIRGWNAPISTVAWAPVIVILFLALLALTGGLPEEVALTRQKVTSVFRWAASRH
jgi:O-antigen/teichoic acid export membrane protein